LTLISLSFILTAMKTIAVAEVEANFSEVLFQVKKGQKFKIFNNDDEPFAMIIPIEKSNISRKIGILDGQASFRINGDGKISVEEFIGV